MLPKEMFNELIGKVCHIILFDSLGAAVAKVVDIEDNWIKIADKNGKITFINGDMVKQINIAPEKQQQKFEK